MAMSRPDPPVPQEAVDALQRGDLVAAFKSLRQAGGINMQAVGRALEAQARQHAEQQANRSGGPVKQTAATPAETLESLAGKARAAQQGVAQQVALHRKRPPTVEMGDAPGSLRWMLVVLVLLAAATWIMLGS
jgi:hypothetical protein